MPYLLLACFSGLLLDNHELHVHLTDYALALLDFIILLLILKGLSRMQQEGVSCQILQGCQISFPQFLLSEVDNFQREVQETFLVAGVHGCEVEGQREGQGQDV